MSNQKKSPTRFNPDNTNINNNMCEIIDLLGKLIVDNCCN